MAPHYFYYYPIGMLLCMTFHLRLGAICPSYLPCFVVVACGTKRRPNLDGFVYSIYREFYWMTSRHTVEFPSRQGQAANPEPWVRRLPCVCSHMPTVPFFTFPSIRREEVSSPSVQLTTLDAPSTISMYFITYQRIYSLITNQH